MNLHGSVREYKGGWNAYIGRRYLSRHPTEAEGWVAIAAFHKLGSRGTGLDGIVTVESHGPTWLDEREQSGLVRCVDKERSIWAMHISNAAFATMPVAKVQPLHIQQWIAAMQKKDAMSAVTVGRKHGETRRTIYRPTGRKLGDKAIRNARGLLRQFFLDLLIAGKITSNPVTDDLIVKSRAVVVENDEELWTYLTPAEIAALFEAIRANRRGRRIPVEKTLAIYAVAIYCGLRQGEVFGLRWRDVHLDEVTPYIEVRQTWNAKPVKTKKSRRTVWLLPQASEALLEWKASVDLERLSSRTVRSLNELVFPAPGGGAYAQGYDADWEKTWRKLAGIRSCVVFHSLRHTCASMLRMGGSGFPKIALQEISGWLGHTSITTTQRYAHLDPSLLREPVARMYRFERKKAANDDDDEL